MNYHVDMKYTYNTNCPLSLFLEDVKEVFYFKSAVFRQISAMHSVFGFVFPENCPQRLRTHRASHFRIMRATEFTQRGDNIFLAYFQGDARSVGKLFDNLVVLRDHAFVNFQKLL